MPSVNKTHAFFYSPNWQRESRKGAHNLPSREEKFWRLIGNWSGMKTDIGLILKRIRLQLV